MLQQQDQQQTQYIQQLLQMSQIPRASYLQQKQSNSNQPTPPNQIFDIDEEVARFLETKNLSEDQKQIFNRYHMQRKAINLDQFYFLFEACDFNEDQLRSILNFY